MSRRRRLLASPRQPARECLLPGAEISCQGEPATAATGQLDEGNGWQVLAVSACTDERLLIGKCVWRNSMSLEMQRQSRKRDDVLMVVRGDPAQVRGRASSQIGEPRRGCFTAREVILTHDFEDPALRWWRGDSSRTNRGSGGARDTGDRCVQVPRSDPASVRGDNGYAAMLACIALARGRSRINQFASP